MLLYQYYCHLCEYCILGARMAYIGFSLKPGVTTFHAIGHYNCEGEFMVQRVFICSNLTSPFGTTYCNKIDDCTNSNQVISSAFHSPSFVLSHQGQIQEGEHSSGKIEQLLPQASTTKSRGRLKAKKRRMMQTCLTYMKPWAI